MSGISERTKELLSRCADVFRVRQADRDLDDELQSHLEMAIEDHQRRGLSATEAREAALRSFGGVTQVREQYRLRRGLPFLEDLRRDVAYALRQMRRSPGFAVTVIGTLTLGIGAAAAMFTVVDHVLLEPVHYPHARQLAVLREGDGKDKDAWYGAPWLDIEYWQKQARSFEQIAFSGGGVGEGRQYLQGRSESLEVGVNTVTANLFPTLGAKPELGRGFLPEPPSFSAGRNAGAIVLSDTAWRAAFGADRSILGRVVRINSNPYTVVGVMPAGFQYPAGNWTSAQVWLPLQLSPADRTRTWDAGRYNVIARLRPGVSLRSATAELDTLQQRVAAEYTNPDQRSQSSHAQVERLEDTLVGSDVRKALLALLAASGLLWLIAAVNVTNLLLARSMARQREIAMRGALGASRTRVIRQMLVEGLVLSAVAGLLGTALALASVRFMAREVAAQVAFPVPATPDGWIVAALFALTIISALMSTAWPAWMAARAPIEAALRQGGAQAGTGRRHQRMRAALVAVEIALSLTLLVGCGLLLRTIYSLRHVPLGYRTDHILVAHLSIPSWRFTGHNLTADLYQPLLARVQHLHGIQAAGLTDEVPLGNTFNVQLSMYLDDHRQVRAWLRGATPGVQKVFGFHMAAGRYFSAEDTPNSPPVVVVNQAFAREFSPNRHDPATILGTKLLGTRKGAKAAQYAQVIGVLDDAHQFSAALPSQPEVEVCISQLGPGDPFYQTMDGFAMDLAIRTDQPSSMMIPQLRDLLRQANPELANSTITTMDQIVEDSWGSQRIAAHLLEIFGGTALLLCVAGLYGLLAYVVSQRTRELGVRIALGAQRSNLLWLIMRQAGAMLLAGIAAGTGMAWASGRLVRGFLYGVSAHDGWTLAAAAALLLVSGLLAAYLPARRAASVDPMRALRSE